MNCRDIADLAPLHLSGELEVARRAAFDSHLSQCRSCARQMEQQVVMDARLAAALAAPLPDATALERSVRARIARERSHRWMFAAAAALVLFAAVLGYRALRPPHLYADAALDHRLEVMEHQPRHWRTDPAEIQKLAAKYQLQDASAWAPAGYRLEHAKMCGVDGKPALHLVYTDGAREFSVYILRRTGAAPRNLHTVSIGQEHLAAFQTDRFEAVIATAESSAECLQFARIVAGLPAS